MDRTIKTVRVRTRRKDKGEQLNDANSVTPVARALPLQQSVLSLEQPTAWLAKLDSLRPNTDNPRFHSRTQIGNIKKSIAAFGFNAPILIDNQDVIICGHGRYEAALQLGLTHVPVVRLAHLSEAQARAYMIADNKLTDLSIWDDGKLAKQFEKLAALNIDFEIEATGFETSEIDIRLQSLDEAEPDTHDDFSAAPGPVVSRFGDLWLLDQNRLLCGSALEMTSYQLLLGSQKASAVFTDPPYNVRISGHAGGKGAVKHPEFIMASGELTDPEYDQFLFQLCGATKAYTFDGAVHFVCIDWRHSDALSKAVRDHQLTMLNLCVWVKTNGGMGSFYRSQHELVFVIRNGNSPHRNNVQLGRFGRNRTNVWNYPGATHSRAATMIHISICIQPLNRSHWFQMRS